MFSAPKGACNHVSMCNEVDKLELSSRRRFTNPSLNRAGKSTVGICDVDGAYIL